MLSNQTWPENGRIIQKMQEQIELNLYENAWSDLTQGCPPTANMNNQQLSISTSLLISNFDKVSDSEMRNRTFSKMRHGLTKSDFQWAREKFLQYEDIDAFAQAIWSESLDELKSHMNRKTLFYGQPITLEVYN